jgi:hypothetical protein
MWKNKWCPISSEEYIVWLRWGIIYFRGVYINRNIGKFMSEILPGHHIGRAFMYICMEALDYPSFVTGLLRIGSLEFSNPWTMVTHLPSKKSDLPKITSEEVSEGYRTHSIWITSQDTLITRPCLPSVWWQLPLRWIAAPQSGSAVTTTEMNCCPSVWECSDNHWDQLLPLCLGVQWQPLRWIAAPQSGSAVTTTETNWYKRGRRSMLPLIWFQDVQ